jgi:putative FmdB family regulatory protein
MPIYEYRRPDGSTFEMVQSFSDDSLTHDPDTGVPVERVLHAPAVHFKGKGFYNTDYGTRKRQRETAASSEESKASANGSSEAKDSSASEAKAKPDAPAKDSKKSEKSKPVAAKG